MEIPIIEIANYPRFHELASTTLRLAARLPGAGSVAIAHHDSGPVTVLRVSGPDLESIRVGEAGATGVDLAKVLLELPSSGSMASVSLGTVVAAPILLASGRRFGSLFTVASDPAAVDSTTLDSLCALARLLGYAIDGERLVSHDRLTGLYTRSVLTITWRSK